MKIAQKRFTVQINVSIAKPTYNKNLSTMSPVMSTTVVLFFFSSNYARIAPSNSIPSPDPIVIIDELICLDTVVFSPLPSASIFNGSDTDLTA